jgi:hypothetical protein
MKSKETISLKDLLVVKDFPYGDEDSEGILNNNSKKRHRGVLGEKKKYKTLREIRGYS